MITTQHSTQARACKKIQNLKINNNKNPHKYNTNKSLKFMAVYSLTQRREVSELD